MDINGQQLRYTNGIINSVALKSEIGYCEMYRSKNACLCMTVKDKKSEFGALPKCNGMCAKQNINIYIENYETRTNNEKYIKCDSANLDTYPYKTSDKSICTDMMWGESSNKIDRTKSWDSTKNVSNVTYYPYLNSSRQYITEGTSCHKTQIENKSSINHVQVNISKGVENSLLCNDINKNYLFRGNTEKEKIMLNDVPEQNGSLIVSGTVPSTTCNNLYVAPPYFTVDKFVNQEQTGTIRSTQSSFCSRNFYNNQRVPANIGFEYNAPENHSVQTGNNFLINSMEQFIGIQIIERPNIPVMRLETSVEPIGLDIRKQHRHLPIKKEICNYEQIENYRWGKNIHVNVPYTSDLNSRTDFIQNKNNPMSFSKEQYDATDSIELHNKHLYGIADFSVTHNIPECSQHNIEYQNLPYTQHQKNSIHETSTKKICSNLLPPSNKNIIREARKPNYRELINHVHALRSATSEDDLNMQIIKRTLSYNQQPKDVPNPIISRKLSAKVIRRNDDMFSRSLNNNICRETYEKGSLKTYENQRLCGTTTNIVSPLDLSVKTIKTKADSTENNSNCKVLVTENGYPPKFNFIPNFSENRNLISNVENIRFDTNGATSNTVDSIRIASKDLKNEADNINMPSYLTQNCNQNKIDLNIKRTSISCKIENEVLPRLKANIVCSLQNCIRPPIIQTCVNQERIEKGTGIKLEVTLKRKAPFDNKDDNEVFQKKICFDRFHHSSFNTCLIDKNLESLNIDMKKTSKYSKTNSNVDSNDYVLNALSVEQPSSHEHKKPPEINTNIAKHEIIVKNDAITNELPTNVIDSKLQDVSSLIASRIRTKAELKGFTFQEEKGVFHTKTNSNKENCHCNYDSQSSVQIDEEDLSAWGTACNEFVEQLTKSCKNLRTEIKESKLCENKIMSVDSRDDTDKSKEPQECFSQESSKHIVEFKEVLVKTMADTFQLDRMSSSQENLDMKGNDNILKQKTDVKKIEIKNDSTDRTVSSWDNKSNIGLEKKLPNHANSHIDDIEGVIDCAEYKKSSITNKFATEYATRNKNKELTNNSRAIDLTKISVVRLKREKYASKRYTSCDNINFKLKNGESDHAQMNKTKEDPTASIHVNKIGRSFPSITKSTLRRQNISLECVRRRQNVNTVIENKEAKFSSITTRLRHQRVQLQSKTESLDKSNKGKMSKKKKMRLHRFQKPNEREMSNDQDKLYLEVYRYKRALKVPPNLITIRNPCTQKMSTSLPDLDLDLQNSLLENEALHSSSDCKVEDVPKSIIDVLHSRVIKSKCQVKITPKHSKNENQHTSKLTMQQCNIAKPNYEPLKLCDSSSSYQEHRNVFETQVLSSRTRREYKLQLNKEVIREIFGGSERPASAPPEIINVNSDYEIAFEKRYNKCYQQLSFGTENEIEDEHRKELRACIQENLDESSNVINTNSKDQTKEQTKHQSVLSSKCKRKRNGRPYRRKFSSGFDYLRKRKKTNTHGLYSYPHLKKRVENYKAEANIQLKSEDDVSREIQKWVLNKGVGQSALHKAARLGYIDVIVYCLEKMGLNPDHKDNAGYTPLHDACVNGSLEIAKVLLQYGANHSEGAHSGIRPLHEASENGHIEIVRMLLSYGADPLLETYSGQTPLMLASDPEMNDFISMHLLDVQANEITRNTWRFPGPWKIIDAAENGYDAFNDVSSMDTLYLDGKISFKNKNYVCADFHYFQGKKNNFVSNINGMKLLSSQSGSLKNEVCEFEIFVDAADAEGELFEFEEANMPLPPLYLLKDEGVDKWVLLSDLCSLLKVKSKDTLLNKIFPSISPSTVNRAFVRELKMCEFLEKATCLQLLCAGEKINICHSKVVLIKYNENVRKILGVKTIFMKL